MLPTNLSFEFLRDQVVGADSTFHTPFGERTMVYCDYTASGRCLHFIENYLLGVQRNYANTHTEDDVTGRNMTRLLHEAEAVIKQSVNAGPDGRIVAVGTGASGAIDKAQQILGIACPPATHQRIRDMLDECLDEEGCRCFDDHLRNQSPVVFVGPYEHHSNEISWRQGIATVVEVDLAADGGVDLAHLESLLKAPEYLGRPRIGSFSAASNVSGMRTPVHDIARLLHRHDAIACFDFAACAPYVPIDMNPPNTGEGDASLDAIFISPHKFLGGPGSSGILVFNRRIYPVDLPPTVAAGGTVDYVGPDDQDFIRDIEEREKAGTPGVMQTIKAALAFQVKDALGTERIAGREHELLARAMKHWAAEPHLEILGNPDPARRIGIVSFNARDPRGRYLHPKFVTALLNDLFGIQSRAGCSCAGPYGHRLLDIDLERSQRYRECVGAGHSGLKPGWCRVGFHFTMDEVDADYVIDAVCFLGRHGYKFLPLYNFDLHTGAWTHKNECSNFDSLSLEQALNTPTVQKTAMSADRRKRLYCSYLQEAHAQAEHLGDPAGHEKRFEGELGELQFFVLDRRSVS
ncbi:MAG: aminotransferase class V-fold PLP-dependent enzyme [Steroidobacteraceae bacterium]